MSVDMWDLRSIPYDFVEVVAEPRGHIYTPDDLYHLYSIHRRTDPAPFGRHCPEYPDVYPISLPSEAVAEILELVPAWALPTSPNYLHRAKRFHCGEPWSASKFIRRY